MPAHTLFFTLSLFLITAIGLDTDPPSLGEIRVLLAEGERAQAVEMLESTVRSGDAGEEEVVLLADLYHQFYRFSELIELIDQYPLVRDGNAAAMFAYAQAKYQTGFKREAIRLLEKARSMEEADERGVILLGRIYYQDEEWALARPVYEDLTERMPGNLYFRTQKARIYRMLQERERSHELLVEILEEDSAYLPAILEMAVVLYTANELDNVRTLLDPALEYYPEEPALWNFSARTAYNQQQYEKAVDHWNRKVDLGSMEGSTFRGMGLSYYQLNNKEKALKNFEKALYFNPSDMTSLMYSAMVYRQMEDWVNAGRILNELYKLRVTDYLVETVMQRAVVLEAQDKIEEAITDYKLASLLDPGSKTADFYRAALLDRHSENYGEAIELYEAFLESANPDPGLEEYARGRLSVLRERQHFARGRDD